MNYYPFHLGDYAAHTAHLTWEEDIAYRRLLDLYYLHEKPVPADVQKLARLIRMPKQVAAIEAVLGEFFSLQEDGWHNKRADDELARMSEKSEASEERDEHEKARMKRYRERRAAMFAALREVGVVPAWDVAMKDLQRLFDENCNGTGNDLQRNESVSGDAPATAIPTPTPTPTPVTPNGVVAPRKRSAATTADQGTRLPGDWKLPEDWRSWCRRERPDLDPDSVAEQFRDFWVAKPGKDGRKADWQATWRNWCRGQKTGAGRRGGDAADWTQGVH